mmetsp:Transcript_8434/g.18470  ORF Transcript_8434/g.18470 Transcript_8434/m.18470 type:complete len:205 (-) Transcript_8434:479-1093(-)
MFVEFQRLRRPRTARLVGRQHQSLAGEERRQVCGGEWVGLDHSRGGVAGRRSVQQAAGLGRLAGPVFRRSSHPQGHLVHSHSQSFARGRGRPGPRSVQQAEQERGLRVHRVLRVGVECERANLEDAEKVGQRGRAAGRRRRQSGRLAFAQGRRIPRKRHARRERRVRLRLGRSSLRHLQPLHNQPGRSRGSRAVQTPNNGSRQK